MDDDENRCRCERENEAKLGIQNPSNAVHDESLNKKIKKWEDNTGGKLQVRIVSMLRIHLG